MTVGTHRLDDEEKRAVLRKVFLEGYGPLALAILLEDFFLFWDEIGPDEGARGRHNAGRVLLKELGIIADANLMELTRRLITGVAPEQLREEKEKP